jgi:hypothetical protein
MSYEDDYDWDYGRDEAEAALIEEGISNQRDDQIRGYLGTYGDAVQERIDRCLMHARALIDQGFAAPAILSAVTAAELAIRYFILRPILSGAFLSEEWASILIGRILTQRSASDRELLPAVLRAWPLWNRFVGEVVPFRNEIVHKGASASIGQANQALELADAFLAKVVGPLSDRFGFSWSHTRCWNSTQQGAGGARSSTRFESRSPFEDEGAG